MKMRLCLSLISSLCFLLPWGSSVPLAKAQEVKQEENKIITSGEAKVWVEPDRARVFLGIETLKETVNEAREENAVKIKKVIEALEELKIKGMLIKAPNYNVSLIKEREYVATKQGRLPKIIGYKVMQNFTVLLKNKDMLKLSKNAEGVIDTALSNGVNIIQRIYFFKEDDSEDKRKAIELAVKDAISNAKAIAEAAGVSIKDYTLINSSARYWQSPIIGGQMMQVSTSREVAGVPTTLAAGRIAITSNVQLQCRIK